MPSTVRRSVLASALCGGVLALTPVAAFADDNYAPAAPSPSVAGVKASPSAPTSERAVESSSAAALPRTGADTLVWTITGGALLLGGGAMVAGSRRRRTARP